MSIGATVKVIQDIMRKDAGVDGDAQRISQLGWMIFLKVFDDAEAERELLDDEYRSPIPKKLRWRTWAKDAEGITGEQLLDFVNGDLFKTLKELPVTGKNAAIGAVVRGVFEDAFNYMKSGTLMRQVINKLNEIDFNKATDRHQFGDIYETILADLQSAGNAGEYYTPRAVTQFIVDMVDPKLGETVLDPACGTGGFLTCAIEHVRSKYVKTSKDEENLQASIFAVEKKQLPHLLCVTNMLFHGIEVPSNIRRDNTLARPLRDYGPKDRVDVILSNPPFGGMEEDGIENNFPQAYRTRETADLFLVLFLTLLKPGGRAGFVLPDGTLFGGGVKARIKEKLLADASLHTVVRLPAGVFSPYTAIKTNLLFFTKGDATKDVWFYEHPYPDGYKSYSKTKPMRIEEFVPEKKWWGKRRETERAWRVSVEDIRARDFNLDIKNPNARLDDRADAQVLTGQFRAVATKVKDIQEKLRSALVAAIHGPARDRVSAEFGQVFDAPANVPALRETFLDLAVRGRLVERLGSDGAAEDLLPELATGLRGISKRCGARVPEAIPEVTPQDEPFQIPPHWRWIRMAHLGGFLGGGTPSKSNAEFWKGSIPWVSPKDMKRSHIDDAEDHISKLALDSSAAKLIPTPSLLYVVRGMILAHSFPVAITTKDVTINQDMKALVLGVPALAEWVLRAAQAARRRVLEHVQRSTHGTCRLDSEVVEMLPVPLPPLREQLRILARLAEVMKFCDLLEEALEERTTRASELARVLASEAVA